jgi:hypothetical protein
MSAVARCLWRFAALPVCLMLCLPVCAQTVKPAAAILPAGARAEAILFEKDLAALCHRIGVKLGSASAKSAVPAAHANPPVSRLRVIAALVKLMVAPDSVEAYKTETPDGMPEDTGLIPDDMMPFVAAAVTEGWVGTEPLKGRQTATWGFVRSLLTRIPTLGAAPEKSKSVPKPATEDKAELKNVALSETESDEKFSGLIVDAAGMKIERSMSPRILDADGQVVYPDIAHVPDPDTVLDKGILDYTPTIEKSRRAGSKPLVIKAVKIDFKDVYVSNEDAVLIRKANKRAKFIETWQVCIVSGN